MKAVSIHSDTITPEQTKHIFVFCETAARETDKEASTNMKLMGWQDDPASFLYLVFKEKRFSADHGLLTCLYDGDRIVAVSGVYRSDFSPHIFLGGVRAWNLRRYRTKYLQAAKLFPAQIEFARNHDGKLFALSFNDYNEKLWRILTRSGPYTGKARRGFGYARPRFYDDLQAVEFPVTIKYTRQWVAYKTLDPDWTFDWEPLRA